MLRAAALTFCLWGGRVVLAQEWEQLPDFPGTARDDAASFTLEATVYVGTGMEVGWGLTNNWFRYNTIDQTWTEVAALPASPRQYCSTFTVLGVGYLFGGLDGSGALNELWEYDEPNDNWIQRSSLPSFPRYATTAFSTSSNGYVAGGLDGTGVATNECWEYDPINDAWSQVPSVPGLARHRAQSFSHWTTPIVAGGADAAYNALNDVWAFDPILQLWTSLAPLPYGIYGGASVSVSYAEHYLLGGAIATNTFQDTVWQYLPASDTWNAFAVAPAMVGGRKGAASGFSSGWVSGIYYGLGLDGAMLRHRDWFRLTLDHIPGAINENFASAPSVHPNPATSFLSINYPEGLDVRGVDIINVLGDVVYSAQGRLPLIDLTGLSAGSFFLRVGSNERTVTASFIKLP